MAALLFKFGALAMKTVAKPLADRFKNWVMSHPQYRQSVINAAQRMHRWEVGVSRRAEGKQGRAFIGDMTEEKSVELASKLASEGFIFVVGSMVLFAEYERTRRKEVKKQAKDAAERQDILMRAQLEREQLRKENEVQTKLLEELAVRLATVEDALKTLQESRNGAVGRIFGGS